jgi:hypothetical protein
VRRGLAVVLGGLVATAAYLTGGAIGALPGGAPVAGAVASTPLWGVDTIATTTRPFVHRVTSTTGAPQFVGRYLTYGAGPTLTAGGARSLHAADIPILLIASPAVTELTTSSAAVDDAEAAVARAKSLGVPPGVAIFRDVENDYDITSPYIAAWYRTVSDAGYVAGFYENPLRQWSDFDQAYCRAVARNPAVGQRTVLYSDEPEAGRYVFARSALPRWAPRTPRCTNNTVAWQYKESDPAVNVDVDEVRSQDAQYLWATGRPSASYEAALQASATSLYTVGTAANEDWAFRLKKGTSPSVTALPGGGYEAALQAATGELWTVGSAGSRNWKLTMSPGTSPSITALPHGGYEVAFETRSGDLATVGTAGDITWNLGMKAGSSPSITALPSGAFEVAVQTNTGHLWTVGRGRGAVDHVGDLRVRGATSPSIAALAGGGYEVAFQAADGDLETVGTAGTGAKSWNLGMMARTSPGVAAVAGGGYELAFQANTGDLWTIGAAGDTTWDVGMRHSTNPSITGLDTGGFEVAVQTNTGRLWTVGQGAGATDHDWDLPMRRGSSPSITGLRS